AAGIGNGERLQGQTQRYRDLLFLRQLHRAGDDLSLRHEERPKQRAVPAESRFQVGRLRYRAGFLFEQRRNESADVPDLQERPGEKWEQPDDALRLRWVRRVDYAVLFTQCR